MDVIEDGLALNGLLKVERILWRLVLLRWVSLEDRLLCDRAASSCMLLFRKESAFGVGGDFKIGTLLPNVELLSSAMLRSLLVLVTSVGMGEI